MRSCHQIVRAGQILCGCCALWGLLSGSAFAAATAKQPNVLFIISDQQPISTIGAYGNPQIKTPHLDRLAREGMRFEQFHIAAFACSPSRACYWTGRWSHHHGVVINDVVLSDDVPTLGSIARGQGYQAAFIGKWHLGGEMYVRGEKDQWSHRRVENALDFAYDKTGPWRGGEDQPQCGFLDKWVGGWTQFQAYLRGVGLGEFVDHKQRVGNHNMAPSGAEGTHIYSEIPAQHHEVAFFSGEAEQFIRRQRDRTKPFCLVLSYFGPHLPVAPPKPWDTLYDPQQTPLPENFADDLTDKPDSQRNNTHCRRSGQWKEAQFRDYIARYWGYCSYIDSQVGRVLAVLDDEQLTDDTIIVYTTDHGDMVAAHGMIFKLASGYDELMRVPFIVRYPRAVRGDTRCAALVQSIDVLPTLLDLCGLASPPQIDGRSFRALLEGKAAQFRDQVLTVMANTIMLATRDWKLVYTCGRDKKPFVELYDRQQRPLEVVNRAGDAAQAATLAEMKQQLAAELRQTGYPYAEVVAQRLTEARVRQPTPAELVWPTVAAFQPAADKQGKPLAEFTIQWNVGEPLAPQPETSPTKYWTFVQALSEGGRQIVSRATLWPEPPTTTWKPGTTQTVGPLRVPILPNMRGKYPVRVGLYCPESKDHPPVEGGAQRIIGTLSVAQDQDGSPAISFHPEK